MPYFVEPVRRVKIQTSSKNYYTTKRLISDLLSNTANFYVRAGEFRGYLFQGIRDRSMRGGTELAREIQANCFWWFRPRHHWRNLFHFSQRKNRLSIVKITHQLNFFTIKFLSRKKVEKKFVLINKNYFRNFNPIAHFRVLT